MKPSTYLKKLKKLCDTNIKSLTEKEIASLSFKIFKLADDFSEECIIQSVITRLITLEEKYPNLGYVCFRQHDHEGGIDYTILLNLPLTDDMFHNICEVTSNIQVHPYLQITDDKKLYTYTKDEVIRARD